MASIAFSMQHQKADNWCWCAVSVSVDVFFNPASTWTQCLMASTALGLPGCCDNPGPCDQQGYLEDALTIVHRLAGPVTVGPVPFADVQAQIGSGKPVCVRIGWFQGGGHFVSLSGWQTPDGTQKVSVEDPFYGSSDMTYDDFCNAYHNGEGAWTHTYPV
jgi:hypothetical protein